MASINLSSFAGAGAQFFDNNGVPLTGGLLYVYTAGTTTPATTYTTSSGTVANTNPIVLDSAGRTPNEVWVAGGVLYKFVLKTSTGVTIGTYDNIPSIDDPTAFNNIITVTGTDTLIGTSTPPNTAYTRGMTLSFVVANTNTGAVTIDVDGLGAKEITFAGSAPLIAGQMTAGALVTIEYDGTRFQLMNSSGALAITASSINGGQIAGFRNRIINGGMQISQRGAASLVANTSVFGGADRFQTYVAASSISSGSAVAAAFSYSSTGYAQFAGPLTGTGVTAVEFVQRIEACNCVGLNSRAITITVGMYHDTAVTVTGSISLRKANSVDNFSSTTLVATSASTTLPNTTYTKLTLTTTLGASDASNGLQVNSTFVLSSTTLTARSFAISDVQLELGNISTPLEFRSGGTELALCQRYYEATGGFMQATAASSCGSTIGYNVTKRVNPTVVFSGITYNGASTLLYQNAFGNPSTALPFNFTATAASAYVSFSAAASAEL